MWRPAEILSDGAHRLAEPVGRVVAKTRVPPNFLTILGFLFNVGVAWIISQGHFPLAGLLIIVAGIFDLLDGAVARHTNKVTRFGALLDSTLDRLSEAVLLFGLLWYFVWQQDTSLEVILIFAIIVGSLLISYVRARAEGLGLDAEVGIMRRTVRILTLSIGLMLSPFGPLLLVTLWGLAILTNLTAVHRLIYVWYKARKGPPH
ncbi:MAG: CDP-alcohol phosphatidyltransferase family protein [Dehalococcoidia bacterium]|nr:MAG: CDP-alcohol phosphatidyltransferase family protein [Dehalococcoidia bacterium]